MSQHVTILILLAGVLIAGTVSAQDKPTWEVSKIADHIYKLSADGGGYTVKVIASVGSDGVLIVDSGKKEHSEDLKLALEQLGGPPKIIINTHSHIEHTAGNMAFGKDPVIIGHENVRKRLRSGSFLFDEFPEEALPEITFTESLTVDFNGEPIKLIAFPGAHDNSDILVWFTKSKVACVGALSNGLHFPSVDSRGDVLKYPEIAAKVMAALPEDVKIIPGHGEDCTMTEFRAFHDMLIKTTEIVRSGVAGGKDKAALQADDALKDWVAFECSYVDRNAWIEYLAEGLTRGDSKPPSPEHFIEAMYYALRDKGVEGAIARYREIKAGGLGDYRPDENGLIYIPYKLYENGKEAEALPFFQLCAAEYPAGQYATFCYNMMGDIHAKMGNKDLARESYTKCLEVDPSNATAAAKLKELDKQD